MKRVLGVVVVVLFLGWCLALLAPDFIGAWR